MTKDAIIRHLISAGITFVATFFLIFALGLGEETFTFSKDAVVALAGSALVAGVRALAKIIYEIAYDILNTK
jgi:hypothetical protein